jgi:excisionase family DNA binding protein
MNSFIQFPTNKPNTQPREYAGDLPVPLCTVGEFAFVTGISEQSIRRYIREGQIPATRIGRRLLIRTDKFLSGKGAQDA